MERRPIRVLHVEDNEFFGKVASEILTQEISDVTVHTETVPTGALARLEQEQFDCVVSDYEMPEMNGLELLDAVREIAPQMPYILMTGGGSEKTASKAISAGVTDYLKKGTGKRQFVALANRIENAVAHRRAEQAVRRQIDINDLIWDVSQSLLEARTREEIEESVCERLAASESYQFAWMGKIDGEGRIIPRVGGGIESEYLDTTVRVDTKSHKSDTDTEHHQPEHHQPEHHQPEHHQPEHHQPEHHEFEHVSHALKTAGIQVTQATESNSPLDGQQQDEFEKESRSKATILVQYEDTVYGVLNVSSDHPHAFDETERRVLSKFGNSVAYAINSVRTRQELRRREQRLQVFNRILRHNLRNDLNVVLGHADNLMGEIPEATDSAEIIKRKATDLIDVSEKAREIGRTLDKRSQIRTAVEITAVIERVCSDLRETYPNVELTATLPDAAWVCGDKTVGTVINEVVENAIKHNDQEEPHVTISVTSVESERENWVEIEVMDDGPGIPEEEQAVLSEGRETALQHGSGLGLWLTNWIVGKFGGKLTFGTVHPRGSLVVILLRKATPPSE